LPLPAPLRRAGSGDHTRTPEKRRLDQATSARPNIHEHRSWLTKRDPEERCLDSSAFKGCPELDHRWLRWPWAKGGHRIFSREGAGALRIRPWAAYGLDRRGSRDELICIRGKTTTFNAHTRCFEPHRKVATSKSVLQTMLCECNCSPLCACRAAS